MAEGEQDEQQLAFHAEQLRLALEQASTRLEALTGMREEKTQALGSLRGVKEGAVGDEVLVPVGGTTFVNAALQENKEVIMGVGAGYAMPRPIDKAIEVLERDVEALGSQIENLSAQAGRLEAEYSAIVQRLQGGQPSQSQ